MGSFHSTSSKEIIFPLKQEFKPVDMAEVDQLAQKIEAVIKKCACEREAISKHYGCDPDAFETSSCSATFTYNGDHRGTFALLQSRFKGKVRVFENGTKNVLDTSDDDYMRGGPNYYFEKSSIKIIV